MLGRILEERAPSLRWMVIEALPFDLDMQNANDFGLRRIEWHDSATTWRLLRELWKSDLVWAEKWSLMQRHLAHWWRRSISLARGMEAIAAFKSPPSPTFPTNPLWASIKTVIFHLISSMPTHAPLACGKNFCVHRKNYYEQAKPCRMPETGAHPVQDCWPWFEKRKIWAINMEFPSFGEFTPTLNAIAAGGK